MAACGEIPEPGRPPETIGGRDPNANLESRLYSTKDTKSLLNFHVLDDSPKMDIKTNCRQTLRKVFFKRHCGNGNAMDASLVTSKKVEDDVAKGRTLITTVSQSVDETRTRKRYSLHQDVEEALNSLLWQPYEYQRSNREKTAGSSYSSSSQSASNSSDYCYDHRTSLCSSSCSSLSSSSGLESSNNGTNRSGNTADLHLLVNNLRPNRLGQSLAAQRSRDGAEPELRSPRCAPCAVSAQRSNVTELQLRRAQPVTRTHTQRTAHYCTSANNNNDFEPGSQWDVLRSPTGDTMRVEIQPPSIKSIITSGNNTAGCNNNGGNGSGGGGALLLLRTDNGQLQDAAAGASSASIPPPPRNTRSTARNLSSVNVVGLPHNHPRQNSVPATLTIAPTSAARTLVPNHARNISEPYRGANSFISNPSPTPAHLRTGTNNNVVSLFNHQRLHSTPAALNGPQIRSVHAQQQQQPIAFTSSTTVGTASAGELVPCSNNNNNNDVLGVGVGVVRTSNNNSRVPLNVSNVNVNYYRAVPVNVVSAVPTIQCLNTSGGGSGIAATSCPSAAVTTASIGTITDSNNVSNVNIVQAMPLSTSNNNNNNMPSIGGGPTATTTCTEVIVHSTPTTTPPVEVVRTFTSTEAQTDDTVIPPPETTTASREQRRRERRERRHQRRLNIANHRHVGNGGGGANGTPNSIHATNVDAQQFGSPGIHAAQMPDLLNTTLPPPYNGGPHPHTHHPHHPPPSQPASILVPPGTIVQSLVPNSLVPNGLVPNAIVPFHPQVVPGQVPLVQAPGAIPVPVPSPTGFRFPLPANGFRRSRFAEDPPKSCCGLLAWRPGSLRWFIALIALVAVCCVLVGTALGAMGPSGRDHLTVSLLMIGVGIILVTVSGVAWRLTSHDSSTCRSMLGLGSTESVEACPRRFVPRLPPSYGRPHHPYAAMMYPEFQYRPPPPSYQASMQEYRLRLLLLDRGNTPQIQAGLQNAVSPPPTYRSHSGSLLRVPLPNRRDASQSEYSCPPSYRSQNSSSRAAAMLQSNSIMHSREQSLSLSESNQDGSVVNVVNILSTNEEDITLDNITLDSLKLEPDEINPLKMLLKGSSGELDGTKDGNLVTIVQTNDQSPVIVTVSGSSHVDNCNAVTEIPNEMEILAHL